MGFKPGWHYVTQSIIGLLVDSFYLRIDSEIEETLRRFCRDEDLQKSSSRRSKVSDSQKKVSRGFAALMKQVVSKYRKNSAWFFSKNSEGSARKSLGFNRLVFGSSLIGLRT